MTDIQKLKTLAEAAQKGPWVSAGNWVSTLRGNSVADCPRGDEDFIAAANPAAVLELIAENERLQRFETAYKEFSDKTDWVRPTATAQELGMHVADILRKRCDDLTSHNQAQADEIVRLRSEAEDGLAVLRTQKQQVECYIKDAERWAFVRNPVATGSPFAIWKERTDLFLGRFADEAIDAAMAQEKQP